jgi:hypothetical protein
MKVSEASTSEKVQGGSWVLLLGLLGGALAVVCRQAFQAHYVMWANDTQFGPLMAASSRLPDTFWGDWLDFWWIGTDIPGSSPTLATILCWLLSPPIYMKVFTPLTMVLLGFSTWVLFRQLKFAPMVCVAGGLAAGLNMHCFSTACWGLGTWNISIAMIFLALAALVTGSIRQTWIKAILAGLAVGMSVMEGFDSGAIMSVYVGIFVVFLCWITESTFVKRISKGLWVGALVVVFSTLIATSTLYTLVATQVTATAGAEKSAREKWAFATQGSLPKLETLRVIIPGIFGYRMEEFCTPPDPFAVSLGKIGGWPERFIKGLTDKSCAYWGRVNEDLDRTALADMESANPKVRAAAMANFTDRSDMIEVMRGDNLDVRAQICNSLSQQLDAQGRMRRHSGNGEYAGVLTAIFAIFALLNSFRGKSSPYTLFECRLVWFWGLAALFSLMAAWGRFSFLYALVYHLPGVSSIRNPTKFMHPFLIAWVILAGFGLEAFSRCYLRSPAKPAAAAKLLQPNPWRRKLTLFDKSFLIGLILVTLGILVAFQDYAGSRQNLVQYITLHGFGGESAARIAAFSIDEARWFVLMFTLSAGVVLSGMGVVWTGCRAWVPWTLLCAIMIFDLSRADLPWVRYFNYDQKYSLNEVTKVLMDKPYEHRVVARLSPRGGYDLPGDSDFGAVIHWWIENDFPYRDIQTLEIDQMPRAPLLDGSYLGAFPYRDPFYDLGGSLTFSADEIKDWSKLVNRLTQQSDPVSAFLWRSLSNQEQVLLANYQPSAPGSSQVQEVVLQALNKTIAGPAIYERGRFQAILLRPETIYIMQQNPTGPILAYFNRFLLEDAYPLELSRDRVGPSIRLWQLTNNRYLLAAASWLPVLNEIGDPQHHSFGMVKQFNLVPKTGVTSIADAGDMTPEITSQGKFALIEYTNALPRAKLYSYWLTPPNDPTALRTLTAPQWDPDQSVLVSSDTPVPPPQASAGTDPGSVSLSSYKPKDIKLQASAKTPAVLLYNDRTAPDWRVWVDGKSSQLLRCNYIMRGVFLPAGEHTVEFRFQPSVTPLYITLSAFVVGILLAAYLIWSRFAGNPPSKTA